MVLTASLLNFNPELGSIGTFGSVEDFAKRHHSLQPDELPMATGLTNDYFGATPGEL